MPGKFFSSRLNQSKHSLACSHSLILRFQRVNSQHSRNACGWACRQFMQTVFESLIGASAGSAKRSLDFKFVRVAEGKSEKEMSNEKENKRKRDGNDGLQCEKDVWEREAEAGEKLLSSLQVVIRPWFVSLRRIRRLKLFHPQLLLETTFCQNFNLSALFPFELLLLFHPSFLFHCRLLQLISPRGIFENHTYQDLESWIRPFVTLFKSTWRFDESFFTERRFVSILGRSF